VYRVDGGRRRHARFHATLEKQTNDVTFATGHLFSDDDVNPSTLCCEVRGTQSSLDGVVICDRDHIQRRSSRGMIDKLRRRRPPIA